MKTEHIYRYLWMPLAGILSLLYNPCPAQDKAVWRLEKVVKTSPIRAVSVDPYFNIYTADNRGIVNKFDPAGIFMLNFSPPKNSEVTLLEAWRNVNIFIFYRNFQEFAFLDRFLTQKPNVRINPDLIGFARLAAPSSDNNLWVIDERDFTLKKFNIKFNRLDIHNTLDLLLDPRSYDLNFMREYQNLLFINDKNAGILVFDILGNYKNKLPFKGIKFFSFYQNLLYFIEGDTLKIFDIYTSAMKSFPLPAGGKYNYAIIGDKKVYLFTENSIEIYSNDVISEIY